MSSDLAQRAVRAALNCEWDEAVKFNTEILKKDKDNIDALNRLARAYAELGKIRKASSTTKRVLKIDSNNKIALKSSEKWKQRNSGDTMPTKFSNKSSSFIEEPGKTKIVQLLNLGSSEVLAKIETGCKVKLNPHGQRLSILTREGKFIGRLPDDIAARLNKLMKQGNEYEAIVKSVDPDKLCVFIRETKRSESLANIPSFSSEKIDYISFTSP